MAPWGLWALVLGGCAVGEEVDALRAEKEDLASRVAELEAEIEALHAANETVHAAQEERLSALEDGAGGEVAADLDLLDERLVTLEEAGLATEAWVTGGFVTQADGDALATRVTATETDVAGHQTRLVTAEASLVAQGTRVSTVETKAAAHDAALATLAGRADGHDQDLAAHDTTLLAHDQDLADQAAALATQASTLQGHADTLQAQATTLEDHDGELTDHGTTLATHGTTLTEHAESLDVLGESLAAGLPCDEQDPMPLGCGTVRAEPARTCASLHAADPLLPDGLYWIDPTGADPWQAYCDMTRDGGGWTLVMQKHKAIATAGGNLPWDRAIHDIAVRGGTYGDDLSAFNLHVGLERWGDIGTEARQEVGTEVGVPTRQAIYRLVLDEADEFRLDTSGIELTVGVVTPGMYGHSGYRYSTYDNDNDVHSGGSNCAVDYGQPYWYASCWNGSMWGGISHQQAPYWEGANADYHDWGALWLR